MESSVTSATPPPPSPTRWLWPLLLTYPVLLVAGLLTQREIFPLLALMVLVSAVLLPKLLSGRVRPWLVWSGMQGLLLALAWLGFADLVLETVPVLINAVLAWWFGRTLLTSRPLIARCIVAGYVVVVAAFALEYPYRRWRLRHLRHLSLPQMLLRLVVNWPRVLRDEAAER